MRYLRSLVLVGILGLFGSLSHAQSVLSFKNWKDGEVVKAQLVLQSLEDAEKNSPLQFGPEEQDKIKTARNNLEIARELNSQDYFILYLSPNFKNNIHAFTEAVQGMEPQDVAQILLAYNKLIEEKKKRSLLPTQNSQFGFAKPRKIDPNVIMSASSR